MVKFIKKGKRKRKEIKDGKEGERAEDKPFKVLYSF